MKKKTKVFLLYFAVLVFAGILAYVRYFQNLPDFAMLGLTPTQNPKVGDRVLVIAPHADDETLGAGGYIYQALKAGADVKVVIVTNGDGERFVTSGKYKKINPKPSQYISTGYLRQEESIAALKDLGLDRSNIIFLGFPDDGLKNLLVKNWQVPYKSIYTKVDYSPYNNSYELNSVYTGENLTKNLTSIVNDYEPTIVFATSSKDLHPDHAAVASFTRLALKGKTNYQIYYYLIHYHRYPYPMKADIKHYLAPPLRLVSLTETWTSFNLDSETQVLKEKAITQYKSQFNEPFLRNLMLSFVKRNELFTNF